ncbi:hypothetical protein NHH03_24875 [Stieleria sp. TO1_6]|uniref:hypothetical protein n=1 Tax=Stieleria tagensis TaxID=2956795 RepID=UPI00209AD1B7|nr:hypothetical protein [Stieleria tagensis]MCO8124994.1 hypothetical protein [Stieleria tagensis]
MKKRSLRFETLTNRQLMAGDILSPQEYTDCEACNFPVVESPWFAERLLLNKSPVEKSEPSTEGVVELAPNAATEPVSERQAESNSSTAAVGSSYQNEIGAMEPHSSSDLVGDVYAPVYREYVADQDGDWSVTVHSDGHPLEVLVYSADLSIKAQSITDGGDQATVSFTISQGEYFIIEFRGDSPSFGYSVQQVGDFNQSLRDPSLIDDAAERSLPDASVEPSEVLGYSGGSDLLEIRPSFQFELRSSTQGANFQEFVAPSNGLWKFEFRSDSGDYEIAVPKLLLASHEGIFRSENGNVEIALPLASEETVLFQLPAMDGVLSLSIKELLPAGSVPRLPASFLPHGAVSEGR